ncbi:MAG: hypothetical protein JWO31_1100, partial [Phycisphaerales bacterium]|nr:hypothetical protein [Phycisphaerales bacterium]
MGHTERSIVVVMADRYRSPDMGRRPNPRRSSASPLQALQIVTVPPAPPPAADPEPRRAWRVAVLLLGILIPQLVLIGPALVGRTLLLPLDILADRTFYLPRATPGGPTPIPKEGTLGDLVVQSEVHRRLVVDEVRAGRLPLWNPYDYCGHPLLAANHTQVFSPYRLLDYAVPSPVAVAWSALLRSAVIAVGSYLFLRRAVGLGWLAAAGGAWCVPLTGTMILSLGYAGSAVVSFLPWVFLAADRCAVRPGGRSAAALAAAVAFTLLAGHAAFAGHVLLAGGAYFVWRHVRHLGPRAAVGRPGRPGLA